MRLCRLRGAFIFYPRNPAVSGVLRDRARCKAQDKIAAGITIAAPVAVDMVRAGTPASRSRPHRYAVVAKVKLPSPRSAENTRPRNRSSL